MDIKGEIDTSGLLSKSGSGTKGLLVFRYWLL
jgi:hypothetical protein